MMFACHANDVGYSNDVRYVNDAWLRHIWRQTSHHCDQREQHHFERSEKHHIAIGDASFEDIQGFALINLRKCGIIEYNKKDLNKEEGIYNAI